jgi:hypothetical protein
VTCRVDRKTHGNGYDFLRETWPCFASGSWKRKEIPEKSWFGVDGRTLATNERIWHMMFSNLGMDVNGVWDQLPQIFQKKKCAAQTTRFDVLVLSPKSIARGSLHGFVNLKIGCQKKYSLSSSIIFPFFCYRQCILHNMSGLKAEDFNENPIYKLMI